jgi:ligand-binding sensor domain-containing protein/two-component sensor histidine kinase
MKIISFLFLIILNSVLYAQENKYVFSRFTKQRGLVSSHVNAIIKDRQGFYWIGASGGLQRYDGRRMLNFQHNPADSNSLPDNRVNMLMTDYKDRLWLICANRPCYYEPLKKKFIEIPVDYPGNPGNVSSLFCDSRKNIWLITVAGGLFFFDTTQNIFRNHTYLWPKCPGLVRHAAEDRQRGWYWLATDKGIIIYDFKKKEYYHKDNNPLRIPCFNHPAFNLEAYIYKDDKDLLWMECWNREKISFDHYRYDINKDELSVIAENSGYHLWGYFADASGTVWAYGSKLAYFDNKTRKFIDIKPQMNSQYGIDFNEIFNMSEDSENNLWLMTNLGLYYFNPQQQYFTTYKPTLNENWDPNSNSFIETHDGYILRLSWGGGGISFYDSSFNRIPPLYGYNSSGVNDRNYQLAWCGLEDSKGIIWVGCQHGRIIQLNPVTGIITRLRPPEFENKTIRSITEDRKGNIWFGTQDNIIVKWERSSNQFKQIISLSKEKYRLGWILRLQPGNENEIWVATTTGGMLQIDYNKDVVVKQFLPDKKNPGAIGSENISEIIKWNDDTLALATAAGIDLFSVRTKTFSHLTVNDGLPAEGIVSMIKDELGNLWFSSADGISKIYLHDKRIRNFGSADGITEQDFQPAGVYRFRNGKIVFANTRGFVTFNPAAFAEAGIPSDVVITGFNVFNKKLSVDSLFRLGNKIRLKNSENYFSVQFASLSHVMSNQPFYYYKLEGADKDWVLAATQEAVYTYLPGGNYTFKVKCISPDGIESKNITSFRIYIQPPVYLQWWFILLALIVIGATGYYIYLLRKRRTREREIIRNRIARDLHDDMGSTLSTINILSSMAKSKLHTDEVKASEYINKISDNSQRMMEAMDDIVWAIKPDNDSMQKIVARMREFATNVLESKDIELDFHVGDGVNEVKLNMEQRRDFFLVFKEAVNNTAKYSKCKKATVQIGELQNRLVLMVKDDGIGFDLNMADGGNGLGNMQKRADALKGRLQIQTKPGEGTLVTLNIPFS